MDVVFRHWVVAVEHRQDGIVIARFEVVVEQSAARVKLLPAEAVSVGRRHLRKLTAEGIHQRGRHHFRRAISPLVCPVTAHSLIAESVLHRGKFPAAFRKVTQKSVIVIIIYGNNVVMLSK